LCDREDNDDERENEKLSQETEGCSKEIAGNEIKALPDPSSSTE
jgi:hypothetical protein